MEIGLFLDERPIERRSNLALLCRALRGMLVAQGSDAVRTATW